MTPSNLDRDNHCHWGERRRKPLCRRVTSSDMYLNWKGSHRRAATLSAALSSRMEPTCRRGFISFSPELTARVNGVLRTHERDTRMAVGMRQHRPYSSILGWIRVDQIPGNAVLWNTTRLPTVSGAIHSSSALSAGQCNSIGVLGLRRERAEHARGLCYTSLTNNALPGWTANLDANFGMEGAFGPMIGSDFPILREEFHDSATPAADRTILMSDWIPRHFDVHQQRR